MVSYGQACGVCQRDCVSEVALGLVQSRDWVLKEWTSSITFCHAVSQAMMFMGHRKITTMKLSERSSTSGRDDKYVSSLTRL